VLAGLPSLVALVWLTTNLGRVVDEGDAVVERRSWVPALDLELHFRLDGFGLLMGLLVTGVGVLVFAYSVGYFRSVRPGLGRLAGLLTLFAGSMLGLVLADDLLVLYTCWELTSITSYLLIGNDHDDPRARAAALHALTVTTAGGLAMLGGFVVVGQEAGTFQLSELLADPPSGTAVSIGLVLILLGAATKSAQYPFHGWLPGAMAAPTPVSTYLHAATMVKAGVYLVARLAPVFVAVGFWRPAVLAMGLVTMIGGGLRALRQYDLKLLLAYGTVSQLGFLVVLFGAGTAATAAAGCVLLLAHAAFKGALFMVAGMLDTGTGTRDLRELPPLGREWRPVAVLLVLSAASMAGLPLEAGFIAKEEAYASLDAGGFAGNVAVLVAVVVGSAITVAYSARMAWGVLVAPRRSVRPVAHDAPRASFAAPAVVLGVVTMVLGIVPAVADPLVTAAEQSLVPGAPEVELDLWHGVNLALVLSGVTIAIGGALFWLRREVARALAAGERIPSSADAYFAVLRGLNALADRVTGIVQNGSLPVYAGVILLTAALLPGVVLLGRAEWPGWPELVDAPAHVPVAAVLIGAALASATIRRRLSAVLFLGVVGYGMAALFVVQGAPDLALTQVAIETLSTVLFVLVLRHFPDRFEPRSTPRRGVVRVVVSTTVALAVFGFALLAGAEEPGYEVSEEMVERAQPDGHGNNVVNVILVDFRGLDTLGEITVLATASIGMVALARAGRRAPRSQRRAELAGAEP
jgi:multicomponent Na+:H+ antiporter subunit A